MVEGADSERHIHSPGVYKAQKPTNALGPCTDHVDSLLPVARGDTAQPDGLRSYPF